jgi:hypothetical protein
MVRRVWTHYLLMIHFLCSIKSFVIICHQRVLSHILGCIGSPLYVLVVSFTFALYFGLCFNVIFNKDKQLFIVIFYIFNVEWMISQNLMTFAPWLSHQYCYQSLGHTEFCFSLSILNHISQGKNGKSTSECLGPILFYTATYTYTRISGRQAGPYPSCSLRSHQCADYVRKRFCFLLWTKERTECRFMYLDLQFKSKKTSLYLQNSTDEGHLTWRKRWTYIKVRQS